MTTSHFISFSIPTAILGVSLFLSPLSASASTSALALQAAQMLQTERWVQPVRIENTNRSSRYPETVYGTVFEFNDVLWFYTATGTQPLKTSKHRTDDFKEDLLPLLRTIDRGFNSFVALPASSETGITSYPSLKNGCVIESIFSLQELQQNGEPILAAKLLLYTSKNPNRSPNRRATGHCVLIYQTPDGMFYIDPPKIDATGTLEIRQWDARSIAAEIESHYGKIKIEDAFFEPFNLPRAHMAQTS
jgi:hypothetical protein